MKTIVFLTALFLPEIALSQTSGTYTHVQKEEVCPYGGILLDPSAMSSIIVEKRLCKKETEIDKDLECQKKIELLKKDQRDVKIERDTCLKKEVEIDKIRKSEQELCLKNANKTVPSTVWFAGGVISGIALSIAIFYISVQTVQAGI